MLSMLSAAGFEVVESEVKREQAPIGETDPDDGVSFLWVLAEKPLGS